MTAKLRQFVHILPLHGEDTALSLDQLQQYGADIVAFGGNPICAAAAQVVLEILDDSLLAEVTEKGAYIRERIERMDLECLGGTRESIHASGCTSSGRPR